MDMESITVVYRLVIALAALGMGISSLEYLVKIEVFGHNGLLSWKVIQIRWGSVFEKTLLRAFAEKIFTQTGMRIVLTVRCITLLLLVLIPPLTVVHWLLLALLFANIVICSLIAFYGTDGSDQMNVVIIATAFLCTAPIASETLSKVGLWFIGLQACLSYTVAGISKLVSSEWRNGTAVRDIFSSKTYGTKWAYDFLQKDSWVNSFLCWNVIIMETLFPLCLILPWESALIFLIWGGIFHLFCAAIMGLNSFFWSFVATYPAIIFIHYTLI
jgi:hypothetical protein